MTADSDSPRTEVIRERVGAVIDRWYHLGNLRFSSRDDGSDDLLLRDEIVREVAALAAPVAPEPPAGTKLILMSDELMDVLAEPTDERAVTWAWGEPDWRGWYTPSFTRHEVSAAPPKPPGHEHYWIDAADDETGWHCTICGVTEYPNDDPDPEDVLAPSSGEPE